MSMRMAAGQLTRAQMLEFGARRALVTSTRALAQAQPQPQNTPPPASTSSSSEAKADKNSIVSPLSPSARPPRKHSALTVALVTGVAKLLGYNTVTTRAIRVTSDLYDRCAERADIEAAFWYGECRLPRTYQTWFQITTLHIHLLLTRFRAMDSSRKAQNYSQELINHFFIDAESRMRLRFGVQTSRLVKGYMKEMHTQQRGAILGMDEALAVSASATTDRERLGDADALLATALWRNIWGAGGWGEGVGGVKRKVWGVDRPDEKKSKSTSPLDTPEDDLPELAQDSGVETSGRGAYAIAAAQAKAQSEGKPFTEIKRDDLLPAHDLEFAESLRKLVHFYRRESVRLANLSQGEIELGIIAGTSGKLDPKVDAFMRAESIATFGKI